MALSHGQVQAWVAAYVREWRSSDPAGVARLFTPEITYLRSPYAEPLVGYDAVAQFWVVDRGASFGAASEVLAVDGRTAVVRLQVDYRAPEVQEYRDLWVLRFAADGRVERFEEWPFFPGQPLTASSE